MGGRYNSSALLTRIDSALKLMTPEEFTSTPVSVAIALASPDSDPCHAGTPTDKNNVTPTQQHPFFFTSAEQDETFPYIYIHSRTYTWSI